MIPAVCLVLSLLPASDEGPKCNVDGVEVKLFAESPQEAYLGVDGKEFTVKKKDIAFHSESKTSIMPAGLLQQLTRQELRDLFAFLM